MFNGFGTFAAANYFAPVCEDDFEAVAKPDHQFANVLYPDDGGAADAEKAVHGQPFLKGIQRLAQQKTFFSHKYPDAPFFHLNTRNIFYIDETKTIADRDGDFVGKNLFQLGFCDFGLARFVVVFGGQQALTCVRGHAFAHFVHGTGQALFVEGLEQVVNGIDLEGRDGVVAIRGGKHHGRLGFQFNAAGHLQAGHTRHFDVEEDQVGAELLDVFEGIYAIFSHIDHLNIRHGAQHPLHFAAGGHFIIGNQDAQAAHVQGNFEAKVRKKEKHRVSLGMSQFRWFWYLLFFGLSAAWAQPQYLLRSALALHRDGDATLALSLADSAWRTHPDAYTWARICEASYLQPLSANRQWYAMPRYRALDRFKTPVVAADLSPDGRWAVASDAQGEAMLWELSSHQAVPLGTAKGVAHFGFDGEHQMVAAFFRKGGAMAWHVAPGDALGTEVDLLMNPAPADSLGLPFRQELPESLRALGGVSVARYNADSSLLLTAHFNGRVLLWDLRRHPITKVAKQGLLLSANTGPRGEIAVAEGADITLIWPDGHKRQGINGHERPVNSLLFDAKGFLFTSAGDKSVRRWDTAVGGPARKWLDTAGAYTFTSYVALHPDGNQMAVATGWAGTNTAPSEVVCWDQHQHKLAVCLGHEGNVRQVAFLADGKGLVSGSDDGTAIRWNLKGEVVKQMGGFVGSVRVVTTVADGFILCDDTGGYYFDNQGKKKAFLDQEFIQAMASHPSLPVVFTAASPGVSAWTLTGEKLWTLPFPQALQVTVSRDGSWLYVRTYEGVFRVCIDAKRLLQP